MDKTAHFSAYAAAFEESYVDNDWARLAPYFTEDAEYDGALGREAVLEKLRNAVDGLDRKMDARELSFKPLREEGDAVIVDWSVLFRKDGCPDLVIDGIETATYHEGRIRSLHDEIDAGSLQRVEAWMAEHGAKLAG